MGLVSFAMGTYSNFSRGHCLPCVGIVPSSTVTYVNPQSRYRKWNYPDSPNSGIITGSRALVLSAIRVTSQAGSSGGRRLAVLGVVLLSVPIGIIVNLLTS